MHVQTGVVGRTGGGVFAVGAGRVVAQPADAPADLVPLLMQRLQRRAELALGVAPDLHQPALIGLANEVCVAAQAMLAQRGHDLVAHRRGHLQHDTQFFIEQRLEHQLVATLVHLTSPVFGIAVLSAAVGNAVAFGDEDVDVQAHAPVSCETHLTHRRPKPAIAAVVVGQQAALGAQRIHGGNQVLQQLRVVEVGDTIGDMTAELAQHLRQHAAGHALLALAQVHQHQGGVAGLQLRREGAAHVIQRHKRSHDQRNRCGHLLAGARVRPACLHRQRVLAHRDADAERRAQIQAHGLDGVVERGVFPGFAAGSHPVGAELHARKLDGRGEQVGDGFAHRHAAGGRCVQCGQRRAFADGHGLATEPAEVGQRHRAIGHGHLPGADHRVAVVQATHRAVADGDEESLARDSGVAQHVQRHLRKVHAGQIKRGFAARHALHVAVHLGRLAQQHVHRHVDHALAGGAVFQHQFTRARDHAHPRVGAALTRGHLLEKRHQVGVDG